MVTDAQRSHPYAQVAWRVGGTTDHPHLRTFVCTDHSAPGTEPWSEDVEQWFNNELNLPGVRRVRDIEFHCGYLAKTLAAVATWRPDNEPGETYLGKHWYLIPAIAVGWCHRRRGGALATMAVERILSAIDQDALGQGASEITVLARVHADNRPAQFLFESNGFDRFPPLDATALQTWLRRWPGQTLDP